MEKIEQHINRMRTALQYISPQEAMKVLVAEDVKPEIAYLAIKAAQLANRG
ncbi:MAG: hypothetical protein GF334_10210 [Candidatus Altiarchaeales archaeon]|nr:hypothetical protein [Candidatus Altiarchaeales archaeon]